VLRILGYEHNIGEIPFNERVVKADTFPMGIHYDKYHGSTSNQEVQAEKDVLKQQFYPLKLVLSVDRLDYTKGIINRLQGYELFLERNPEWRKKISLLLIVVPSRIGVDNYRRMKKQIDEMVGRVNGKYSDIGWTPIVYQFKHLSFPQLTALYSSCDIALVTPLRDGMNLVAKEYVAARTDATGVIILSEMAGAAKELGEAIIINPYHRQEIADALREALEMPCEEQRRRIEAMQSRLKRYDVIHWVDDFLQSLNNVAEQKRDLEARLLPPAERRQIIREFKTAAVKIVFLDYDGTLVPFVGQPGNAQPDADLLGTLEALARYPGTDVVLISGRDTDTLEQWFGTLHITLVAEHGVWVKEEGAEWQLLKPLTSEWKAQLMPIIQCYVERLPGSFMEEKGFSVVWHFRNAEPELASVRAKELMDDLITFTANTDVQVLQGSKVIEVRNAGINKGVAGTHFLSRREYDLILAVGDDWTDEDLFKVIPQRQNNYTLKVGITPSNASYNLKDYKETRKLLEEMIR
jgi:trehalose 6-phosphate synthase/phosphatase